jgi:hypothetical protein
MKEILIKNTPLTPFESVNVMDVINGYHGIDEELKNKEIIFHNVNGTVPHLSYIEYLKIAYNTDYGIIIKPDFLWHVILCEIAKIINTDQETYRHLFTNSTDKIEIAGNGTSMIELPAEQMIDLVLKKIPIDFDKLLIIPEFSTLDDDSRLAFSTAFLDAMSPYYKYSYYGCVYNKIKILGTKDDYELIRNTVYNIRDKIEKTTVLYTYLKNVMTTMDRVDANWDDDAFWTRILWTENGYMSDTIDGWILGLTNNKSKTHISKVNYTELTYNRDFTMLVGLFSSIVENGYMIPSFQRIIFDRNSIVQEQDFFMENLNYMGKYQKK